MTVSAHLRWQACGDSVSPHDGIIGKIPAVISLTVPFGLIAGGVLVPLWKTRGEPALAEAR